MHADGKWLATLALVAGRGDDRARDAARERRVDRVLQELRAGAGVAQAQVDHVRGVGIGRRGGNGDAAGPRDAVGDVDVVAVALAEHAHRHDARIPVDTGDVRCRCRPRARSRPSPTCRATNCRGPCTRTCAKRPGEVGRADPVARIATRRRRGSCRRRPSRCRRCSGRSWRRSRSPAAGARRDPRAFVEPVSSTATTTRGRAGRHVPRRLRVDRRGARLQVELVREQRIVRNRAARTRDASVPRRRRRDAPRCARRRPRHPARSWISGEVSTCAPTAIVRTCTSGMPVSAASCATRVAGSVASPGASPRNLTTSRGTKPPLASGASTTTAAAVREQQRAGDGKEADEDRHGRRGGHPTMRGRPGHHRPGRPRGKVRRRRRRMRAAARGRSARDAAIRAGAWPRTSKSTRDSAVPSASTSTSACRPGVGAHSARPPRSGEFRVVEPPAQPRDARARRRTRRAGAARECPDRAR